MPRLYRQRMRPWSPIDLGLLLVAWFDPNDPFTVSLNGSNVSTLRDKSANQYHLYQPTAAAQPGYIAPTSGARAAIDFTVNSPSSLVAATNLAAPLGAAPRAMVGVYTPKNASNAGPYIMFGQNTGGQLSALTNYNNHDPYFGGYSADADSNITYLANVKMLATGAYTGSQLSIAKNGGAPVSFARSLNTPSGFPIRICGNTGGVAGQPHVAHEYAILRTAPSVALMQIIQAYFAWGHGLQSQLPSDHPYRTRRPMVPVP